MTTAPALNSVLWRCHLMSRTLAAHNVGNGNHRPESAFSRQLHILCSVRVELNNWAATGWPGTDRDSSHGK